MTKFKKLILSSVLAIMMIISAGCEALIDPVTELELHFIDVGQGDSTLILTPGGYSMLIDAGDNTQGENVASYIRSLGISRIDVLIGTHPDADHIGGIDDIIDSFEIGDFYMPRKTHDTKTYEDVLLAAKAKGLKIKAAESDKAIAYDLGISSRTVEVCRASLARKLGVQTLAQTLRIAFAAGMGRPPRA